MNTEAVKLNIAKSKIPNISYMIITFIALLLGIQLSNSVIVNPVDLILNLIVIGAVALIMANPINGIYLIVIEEFWLILVVVYGYSIGLAIIVLTFISTVIHRKFDNLKLSDEVYKLFKYMSFLFAWILISLSINGYLLSNLKLAFNVLFYLMTILLLYIHLNTKEKLFKFLRVALFAATLSAFVAII